MRLDLELIGHNGLRGRFPWLGDAIVGGSLCPATGTPIRALSPQPSRCGRGAAGANIREQTPVHQWRKTAGGFRLRRATGSKSAHASGEQRGRLGRPFAEEFGEHVPIGRIYP